MKEFTNKMTVAQAGGFGMMSGFLSQIPYGRVDMGWHLWKRICRKKVATSCFPCEVEKCGRNGMKRRKLISGK